MRVCVTASFMGLIQTIKSLSTHKHVLFAEVYGITTADMEWIEGNFRFALQYIV